MIRVILGMGGLVAIGFILILIAYIADRGEQRGISKRKEHKQLRKSYEVLESELKKKDKLILALDKAAEAEYAVNTTNVFAATVSDTIARANNKARSLT